MSKIEAEVLLTEWCEKHNSVCTILRLLVGKNPTDNLAAMIRVIDKGYYFDITGGKAKKRMVLAYDAAKLILTLAEMGRVYSLNVIYLEMSWLFFCETFKTRIC